MTATTYAQYMAAFKHITHTIMRQDDGSPLLRALANSGIDNIYDMLTLTQQQMDALEYNDSGTMKLLDNRSKNDITVFKWHVWHRRLNGTRIYNDYLSVTPDGFDDSFWRITQNFSPVLNEINRTGLKYKNELEEFYAIETYSDEEEDVIRAEETAKENVPRELEQPDLKEKSALAVKEHDKDIGRYYNKTDKYEEYKTKVFLVLKLWRTDPPSPELPLMEPPSAKPPPEPPPPERL